MGDIAERAEKETALYQIQADARAKVIVAHLDMMGNQITADDRAKHVSGLMMEAYHAGAIAAIEQYRDNVSGLFKRERG